MTSARLRLLLSFFIGSLYGLAMAQTSPLNIDSYGNVGIGTSTPKCILEIRKDNQGALGPVLLLQNNGGGKGAGGAIEFSGYDQIGKEPSFRIQSIEQGNYSSHLVFYSKDPGAIGNKLTERVRIASGGYKRSGTEDPGATLAVNGRIQDSTGWVMPVGTIVAYGGTAAPMGWEVCDGRSIREAKFADLRKVLSGSNTTPNLQGRFIVGTGTMTERGVPITYNPGDAAGEAMHQLSIDEMPSHTHNYDAAESETSNGGWVQHNATRHIKISDRGGVAGRSGAILNAGGNKSHENRPPYYALIYIIKY